MRLIDADELVVESIDITDLPTDHGLMVYRAEEVDDAPTVNAVVIPDNATNLDVFTKIFKGTPDLDTCPVFCISKDDVQCECDVNTCKCGDWWNIPYKKGEE